MASPPANQDHQSKKEPAQSSDSNHPPPSAPPTHQQSPATGFPPAMGYPPDYQNHNYPNAYGYPYTQPPPPAIYANRSYSSSRSSSGFARGILAALICLVIFTCMASLITWLVLRPEIPEFQLQSMSVSNFNVSSGVAFTSNWDANVTFVNPNKHLKVYFDRIEGLMYYKENILAAAMAEPFLLERKEQDTRAVKLKANSTEQLTVGSWVVAEMGEERKSGAVSFNLRMGVWTTFKTGSWWTRHATLKVVCDEFKVVFDGATGNGASDPVNIKQCLVYM